MYMLPWVMVHLQKPKDVPVYTIWRVNIYSFDMFRIFIEVLCDHSSSLYMGDGFTRRKMLYIAVDKEINILLHSTMFRFRLLYTIWLQRQFIHDQRITKYISEQTPQKSHFSYHNKR